MPAGTHTKTLNRRSEIASYLESRLYVLSRTHHQCEMPHRFLRWFEK